jgi:MFS family permease
MKRLLNYQTGLSVLLGLTFGIVVLDRGSMSVLASFIVADLHLTNTELGIAGSIVSLTWALTGYLVGRTSDSRGIRKPYLIVAVVTFSLCTIASGFVGGFTSLLVVRLLMGVGEGPVPPLNTALIIDASTAHRRGLNIGLYALFTGLVGGVFAPLILVGVATEFGWRMAFYVAGVPGLIAAVAIALYVRERPSIAAQNAAVHSANSRKRIVEVLRNRNVWLCALIASLVLACIGIGMAFLPLFLVRERQLSPLDMGLVMSVNGMSILLGGLLLPTLSDRYGRKVILVIGAVAGSTLPLTCLLWDGSIAGLAALCAISGLAVSLPHLAIAIIPAESVAPCDRAAALGLVMGVAEITGGFIAPAVAGKIADETSLGAALVIAGVCVFLAGVLSMFLRETAPQRMHQEHTVTDVLTASK